jgi:hypothetical protein
MPESSNAGAAPIQRKASAYCTLVEKDNLPILSESNLRRGFFSNDIP